MPAMKIKTLLDEQFRRLSRCFIDEQQRKVVLAQLFSAVAMLFLVLFIIDALVTGNAGHALILAVFILLNAANYLWLIHAQRADAATLVIIVLMGAMCLYLFYTGGIADTGWLWTFVFIPVAVFLGGLKRGSLSVILLLAIILVLMSYMESGVHHGLYTTAFIKRFVGVYIALFILTVLNEYFREGSHRHIVTANQRLDALFRTDDLTGLYNRRHIMEQLAYEMLRLQRKNVPFSVILFDIDYFKKINDNYGHICGDYVLKCVSLNTKKVLRSMDIIARIGGEEFLILMPDTHLHGAALVAERLRKEMEQYPYSFEGADFRVTISLGVTETSRGKLLEEVLQIVDDNLYKAKQRGRNRMVAV